MNDDNTAIRFHVTAERLNDIEFGTLLDITEGDVNYRSAADFLALFAVGDDGQYLDADAAYAAVRRLKVRELIPTVNRLAEEMQETAVPNG